MLYSEDIQGPVSLCCVQTEQSQPNTRLDVRKYVRVWEHLSASETTGTEREKMGQRAAIAALRFSPFRHRGEAKEVTHTYKRSINLRATLLVLDTVPLTVCLPSLQPVPGCNATSSEVPLHQMPSFLPVLGLGSVLHHGVGGVSTEAMTRHTQVSTRKILFLLEVLTSC